MLSLGHYDFNMQPYLDKLHTHYDFSNLRSKTIQLVWFNPVLRLSSEIALRSTGNLVDRAVC